MRCRVCLQFNGLLIYGKCRFCAPQAHKQHDDDLTNMSMAPLRAQLSNTTAQGFHESVIVNRIHSLRDPNDPQGRSFRDVNAARYHTIPVGSLVEIIDEGVRLFVVHHSRDCDQTPLYNLCADKNDTELQRPGFFNPGWRNGISEQYLKVIV